jgi:hypothetical protein
VLISRLLVRDGFHGPRRAADLVAACVVSKFYADNPVQRTDVRNEAATVDGHPAWRIEMQLTHRLDRLQDLARDVHRRGGGHRCRRR